MCELYKITIDATAMLREADCVLILQEDNLVEFWISWLNLAGRKKICSLVDPVN